MVRRLTKQTSRLLAFARTGLKLERHSDERETDSRPIFANSAGHPLDLNACYQRGMKDVLKRAGITWQRWHGFRRGLASNLNRLGVDDSVIQRILRHSNVSTTEPLHQDRIARCDRCNEAVL